MCYLCQVGLPSSVTQNGHNLIVLYHLQAAGHNEAQTVNAFAGVVQQIARRRMGHHEMHGQCAQTSVRGQPKGRMLVEHFAIEMHTNVSFHIFRTIVKDLQWGNPSNLHSYLALCVKW